MTDTPQLDPLERSIRRHVRAGLAISVGFVVVVFGWGASAELASAVVTVGRIVVETSAKKVQHPTGGVVKAILVTEGERVTAGETLVVLDDTQVRASLALVSQSLDEMAGRRARLEAERDGDAAITFPAELTRRKNSAEVAKIILGETRLFEARSTARSGQAKQLEERIAQMRETVDGYEAQRKSKDDEIVLIGPELAGLEELLKKKLVPLTRVNALRRDGARLEGERGRIVSGIAEVRGKIAETELQIIQVQQDLRTEVLRDLREVEGKLEELRQRQIAAADQLARIELKSPQTGIVNQLTVHTIGGVIGAGDTLMQIVPIEDRLVIDAKIAPQDVDQLIPGQNATIRLTAFNQRTTPEVFGTVRTVSADLVRDREADPTNEPPHYSARIDLVPQSIEHLSHVRLVPGMPVEVHVQTEARSALSYFMRPLTDQWNRAFREQ